jgi:hypothetical protein
LGFEPNYSPLFDLQAQSTDISWIESMEVLIGSIFAIAMFGYILRFSYRLRKHIRDGGNELSRRVKAGDFFPVVFVQYGLPFLMYVSVVMLVLNIALTCVLLIRHLKF